MGDRLCLKMFKEYSILSVEKKEACFESTDHFLPLSDTCKQIVSGECRSAAAASRCHVVAA